MVQGNHLPGGNSHSENSLTLHKTESHVKSKIKKELNTDECLFYVVLVWRKNFNCEGKNYLHIKTG